MAGIGQPVAHGDREMLFSLDGCALTLWRRLIIRPAESRTEFREITP
jgi:hypothetical protein